MVTVSVVVPFYNEAAGVEQTLDTLQRVLEESGESFEIVAIDDGSDDKTFELLEARARELPQLRAIGLSRNFGKEAALCAGLDYAQGQAVILLDGDLQHPPEHIPEMLALWRQGYKVVEGVKSSRGREGVLSRLNARFFYHTFKKLSGFDLNDASDFKLLDREVVTAWQSLGERDTFFRGLSAWLGFRRTSFPFAVAERQAGESKWGFWKLLRLSVGAITGFSAKPLYLIALLGFLLLLGFLVLGIQTLVTYFAGRSVAGFTTVILLQLLIGGSTLMSLGLIGTYVGRIFNEVKGRPRYLVEKDTRRRA